MKLPESVAIVVCSHKWMQPLEKCLAGFRAIATRAEDLIFVNNGCKNGLDRWAAERFPGITVLGLPQNLLYCGGYNAGIRVAMDRGYEFVLLSNADTEVVNSVFLRELVDGGGRWPQAAFLGPQVFWRDPERVQKTCLQFPSLTRSSLEWFRWHLAKGYFDGQGQEEAVVEFVNGVCVLCRVKALMEIGLLDENIGAYVEDADWSWRARAQGWLSVFIPVPSVVHHESEWGYEPYSLKTFLLKRNTVYWFLKIGRRVSACSYAQASMALALVRGWTAGDSEERQKHRYFFQRLTRAFRGLLRNEPLREWFGPPLGPWRDEHEF
jgi:GT2 family glycosyltransferase